MSASEKNRVLIADDEEGLRFVISKLLLQEGCEVDTAESGAQALRMAEANAYDLYVLDLKMPEVGGMDVLRKIRQRHSDALVIIMTAFGSESLAIEALRSGAYDYFTKPFELEELRIILRRALEKQRLLRQVESLQKRLGDRRGFHRLTGTSQAMLPVFELIRRVSGHDITVLITGESGVGKEMVVAAIHESTFGPNKPFIKINCAAIPEPLLESELFGHAKGAFTGAVAHKPGKFELAEGGSILLDEIGEMPLALQAKLLRVIQEKQVERVGETRPRNINVRIMASTNRDLREMVDEKTFREDLYFRVNVMPIHVPPLRDRVEDIAPLVAHFLEKYPRGDGTAISSVAPEAMILLEAYSWPGNVRELENVMQRAVVMASGDLIDLDSLPTTITQMTKIADDGAFDGGVEEVIVDLIRQETFRSLTDEVDRVVGREEKRIILAALREMNNKRQETADLLGISRKSLHNKMHKYGLLKPKSETS